MYRTLPFPFLHSVTYNFVNTQEGFSIKQLFTDIFCFFRQYFLFFLSFSLFFVFYVVFLHYAGYLLDYWTMLRYDKVPAAWLLHYSPASLCCFRARLILRTCHESTWSNRFFLCSHTGRTNLRSRETKSSAGDSRYWHRINTTKLNRQEVRIKKWKKRTKKSRTLQHCFRSWSFFWSIWEAGSTLNTSAR